MAKRVMLAVAGAGKTYHICNSIQPDKKNLILAYTHENIRNINRELISAHGYIPELTNVMTFHSFVYRFLLCPYEPTILKFFKCEGFKRRGITTKDPPPQRIRNKYGESVPNPYYIKKDKIGHYATSNGQYYCESISELIMIVKEGGNALINKAIKALNFFYDQIMIDEFQDFREHDYDLVVSLAKGIGNILLVGDYYQHSVSAVNNSGRPFKKRKEEVSYIDFKQNLTRLHLEVDEETLKASRRCPREICEYVKSKLQIEIKANNDQCGKVIWVKENLEAILEDNTIIKLVYENSSKYSFCAVNWSYSKGDTMKNVCIILTQKFDTLDHDEFTCNGIPKSTLNKLYVAMTRTKGNLYLVKNNTFQTIKEKYYK